VRPANGTCFAGWRDCVAMPTRSWARTVGVEKTMEPSFEKSLALLAAAGVDFVVVGGVAVALNGYVRLMEDVAIPVSSVDAPAIRRRATVGRDFSPSALGRLGGNGGNGD